MSSDAIDLIARLLTLDPERRMSAKTALEGRYYTVIM
jgi:serine/threonine protein kinase